MLSFRLLAAVAALSLLSACAPRNPWMHPTVPKDQWSDDYSACRFAADRSVGWREEDHQSSNPLREYDRLQAKRQYDALVTACMRERGYVPAPRKD